MAEREGFEPSVEFPLHTLSKRAPSTTRTSLRFGINDLRAVRNSVAQKSSFNLPVTKCAFYSAVYGAREENVARIVIDLLIFHDHLRRFASGSIALVVDAHEQSTADAFYDPPDAFDRGARPARSGRGRGHPDVVVARGRRERARRNRARIRRHRDHGHSGRPPSIGKCFGQLEPGGTTTPL